MGEVYRAKHAMLRRPTAVKLLKPERSSPEMIGRFEREVQLTSQLTHPNTIAIFDYGRTPDNVFYYAMELLEGINLEDLVETFGPQPSERVRFILLQACASLQEAHIVGLIHRDIKPANIFLCVRGGLHDFVKVLDFGLVRLQEKKAHEMTRLTQLGTTTGTPAFMAPEMILGEDLDCRVDIYALGCVGYWLLTGKLLFEGGNAMAMAMAHTKEEPIPPSERVRKPISPSIEKVILSCLEKDPSKRPSSAESLAQLLEECELGNEWSHETAKSWWNRFIYKTKDQSSPRTRLE
jgi:serine/threonine protein kinase